MFWRKKKETEEPAPTRPVLYIATLNGTFVVDPAKPVLLVSFIMKDGTTEDITQKTPITGTRRSISASEIYDAMMPLAERYKNWVSMEVMFENGDRFFVMRNMFVGANLEKPDPKYEVY